MQGLVQGEGDYRLGNRVIVFSKPYSSPPFVKDFTDGVHDNDKISDLPKSPGADVENTILPLYASNFGESGYVTAILTAKGWYLLPSYQLLIPREGRDAAYFEPDYMKFIQTGDIDDLTVYQGGAPLVLKQGAPFSVPILIS